MAVGSSSRLSTDSRPMASAKDVLAATDKLLIKQSPRLFLPATPLVLEGGAAFSEPQEPNAFLDDFRYHT